MAILGRKTLKSERAKTRVIDKVFERTGNFVLIVFFLFVLASWLSYREAIRIDSIEVSGAASTDPKLAELVASNALAEQILWKIDRNNSVLLPERSIREGILAIDPRIKSVTMDVVNHKLLAVAITEYTPTFLWCPQTEASTSTPNAELCFLADPEGYIFAKAPSYSGYPFDVFRTNIPGREEQGTPIGLSLLPAEEFAKVAVFHRLLLDAGLLAHEIVEGDPTDYHFLVEGNWEVLWSSRSDPAKSMENLTLVLAEIKKERGEHARVSSIDLRFGSKVFYVDAKEPATQD